MVRFIKRYRNDIIWVTWLLYFAVAEAIGLASRRDGDTLSERVRVWFRTKSRAGHVGFLIAWTVFAIWFLVHILWGWIATV